MMYIAQPNERQVINQGKFIIRMIAPGLKLNNPADHGHGHGYGIITNNGNKMGNNSISHLSYSSCRTYFNFKDLNLEIQDMKPRISVLTLGVTDLEKAVQFYRDGLGLSTKGIIGKEFEIGAVAFFDLQSGVKLALWPKQSLAADTGIPQGPPSPTEFTIGHNVASKEEVDAVMEQAKNAGAKIVKPAADTFWGGYAGYFQDPDQHLWEVVWNPEFEINE